MSDPQDLKTFMEKDACTSLFTAVFSIIAKKRN